LKIFLKKSKKVNLFRLLLIRTYEAKLRKGNSWIGYNADIPANSVVAAAPTRIIQKEKLDNRYFTQRENKWVYYDNGYWKESDTLPSLRNL
jgi:hypothetical protein